MPYSSSTLTIVQTYFLLQLLLRMHTLFFNVGSAVARAGQAADKLMIIVSGRVKIYEQGRESSRGGHLLTLGPG